MGKSTMSMAMFNSKLLVYQRLIASIPMGISWVYMMVTIGLSDANCGKRLPEARSSDCFVVTAQIKCWMLFKPNGFSMGCPP